MVGKNNRPPVQIIEDDGWLNISIKTGGCTSVGIDIPDDKVVMRKLIAILEDRINDSAV